MKYILLGILLLSLNACSQKKPGVEISEAIWPYEFYNRFNLRTIISSYSNPLKVLCASYPKDFYRPSKVRMPNTEKVVIEDKNHYLSFELVSQDQVIVEDIIKDGTYHATHLYRIYYNEENDDFRTESFFIPQRENCIELVLKEDENSSEVKRSTKK